MTSERVPAPPEWSESEFVRDDSRPEQGQPPTIFRHASRDVAVHVRPDGPEAGGSREWGVGVAFGGHDDVRDVDPVEQGIEDRATAIGRAKELMEAFNREGVPESPSDVDLESLLSQE